MAGGYDRCCILEASMKREWDVLLQSRNVLGVYFEFVSQNKKGDPRPQNMHGVVNL